MTNADENGGRSGDFIELNNQKLVDDLCSWASETHSLKVADIVRRIVAERLGRGEKYGDPATLVQQAVAESVGREPRKMINDAANTILRSRMHVVTDDEPTIPPTTSRGR